jgi:hypothetical protein
LLFHPSLGELLADESGNELAGPAGYTCVTEHWLVGWTMNFCFSIQLGRKIIPTDELTPSFFRGVGIPTTNQIIIL